MVIGVGMNPELLSAGGAEAGLLNGGAYQIEVIRL